MHRYVSQPNISLRVNSYSVRHVKSKVNIRISFLFKKHHFSLVSPIGSPRWQTCACVRVNFDNRVIFYRTAFHMLVRIVRVKRTNRMSKLGTVIELIRYSLFIPYDGPTMEKVQLPSRTRRKSSYFTQFWNSVRVGRPVFILAYSKRLPLPDSVAIHWILFNGICVICFYTKLNWFKKRRQ